MVLCWVAQHKGKIMSINYTVTEINNGIATVQYDDGTWTYVEIMEGWTQADLDDFMHHTIPPHLKSNSVDTSGIAVGTQRTSAEKPAPVFVATYADNRKSEYGTIEQQIEYITENGLSAWQTKVAAIKAKYPKPADE